MSCEWLCVRSLSSLWSCSWPWLVLGLVLVLCLDLLLGIVLALGLAFDPVLGVGLYVFLS